MSLPRAASLTLLALALAALVAPWPFTSPAVGERVVRLTARQFAFDPPQVEVAQGERVVLELTSADVVHGLYLDGYDIELKVDPGQRARASFIADQVGTFRMRCSVTCGPLHPFMIGELKVRPAGGGARILLGASLATLAGLVGLRDDDEALRD